MTEIKITGLAELDRKLKEFAPKVARRMMNRALLAGAKPIVQQAKALAPVGTDRAIQQNIKAKLSRRDKLNGATNRVVIGVEHGKQKNAGRTKRDRYRGDPFYWRFQELGFHAVGRRKAANRAERRARKADMPTYGRFIPGKKFMQRALDQQAEIAVAAVAERLRAEIRRLS